MFCVILDFGGMVCEGFYLLSLSISQLSNEVANLNVVGLYEIVGWASSYHTTAQRFWIENVDENVSIVGGDSWLWLGFSPRSLDTPLPS